ncbi:hypothetical protein R3W88_030326 [Solanum pinnatisectum]|uniref:FAF domain-containing protein n=1 Tax=Solanum pinnatisectum TaxID=50273 RepID=A0AAV9K889_9SOLN|nr:hypothetical protein R3W88_030326 [Solanum pinnatisectum]
MASLSELEEYEQQYRNRKPKNNIPKKGKQPKNTKKEYPPPIPSWRGTLPRDVPWSLSRHNVDGRLILKEETMEYYEYLEATRENGRLVLKLIVLKGYKKCHDQNDFDDTIHEDEITRDETINRREKKKRIQEEAQKESKMINRDVGIKKRRGHY